MRPSPVAVDGTTVVGRKTASRTVPTDLLFAAAYVGTAFIRVLAVPSRRIAWVDLVLAVSMAVGVKHLRPDNPAWGLLRRTMPWASLYVVANLIALLPLGLPTWAVDQLARDLFVLGVFFCLLAYFVDRPPARRLLWLIVPAMAVAASVATLAGDGAVREGGFFRNPNYSAHFIIAAVLCVLLTGRYALGLKVAVLAVSVAGVLATGSFSSFVFAGAALLYVSWSSSGRLSLQLRTVTRIVLICVLPLLIASSWSRFQEIEEDGVVIGNVDAARFGRTSGVRTKIWSNAVRVAYDHPLGIGNGGAVARSDIAPAVEGAGGVEVHNDYLAIVLESGIIGLIGIGGVAVAIWRAARPGGPTRVLLFGVLATGLTREVINFRHAWVLLALVLATEWTTTASDSRTANPMQPVARRSQGALAPIQGT